MRLRWPLGLALLSASTPALVAGTITGRVELTQKGGRTATDLSDVVVYVEGTRAKAKPSGPNPSIVMKGKSFSPRVTAVPVGGTVEFPNEDPIFHNVFSVSGENRFDLALYKRPKSGAQSFQHPGVVRVYCNIHPQMSAVIVVRDNPYFTKAATDGSFAIEGVPAGKYTLTAWHEKASAASQEIVVPTQGQVTAKPVSLDASGFKQMPHKNKFGKDYSTDEKY